MIGDIFKEAIKGFFVKSIMYERLQVSQDPFNDQENSDVSQRIKMGKKKSKTQLFFFMINTKQHY